jgi:uncharacterized integral membrane protein (TIGR00698 family)
VRLIPGLLLAMILAALGVVAEKSDWLSAHGVSALTVALVLGLVLGNSLFGRIAPQSGPGVSFAKQRLLKAGIVLYGLRLTLRDVAHVGATGVTVDALTLSTTFALAWLLGTRVFRLNRTTAMLIGTGSAICGAAAVLAAEPVVRGRSEQVSVAIATVVVFGTLAIFLYPALYSLAPHWNLLPSDPKAFGVYIGSTVHEVAQVLAAGRAISGGTADTAVITKMVRVMMLGPFLLALSAWLARDTEHQYEGAAGVLVRGRVHVPWFALGFVAVILLNSTSIVPAHIRSVGIEIDTFMLATAMAALGLTTHLAAIRQAGVRPLLLATTLFAWLVIGGAAINTFIAHAAR